MVKRHWYHFTYLAQARARRREIDLFLMRDSVSALLLADPLRELGYHFGGPLLQYPWLGEQRPPQLLPFDVSHLRANDLIVITTRPPMSDHLFDDRRGMNRSWTTIEDTLFQGPFAFWFDTIARSQIILTDEACKVSQKIAQRQSQLFRQNGGSSYVSYGSSKRWKSPSESLTAAYLMYARHVWPGGPGVLLAFGMSGNDGLIWCHELATRSRHLLCSTRFCMAEMKTGGWPDKPETLTFADSWPITILGTKPEEDDKEVSPQKDLCNDASADRSRAMKPPHGPPMDPLLD